MKNFVSKFKYLAIISFLVLSGCTSNRDLFNEEKKGVVLFAVTDSSKEDNIGVKYILKQLNKPNKEISIYNSYMLNNDKFNNYKRNILFLDPGFYYIDEIILFYGSYSGPGRRESAEYTSYVYGAFYIKAGEVKALGKLDINGINSSEFKYYDEFSKIKYDLEKSEYSYLVPKLNKGLFFKPGTIYFKGKFYNRKTIELENSMDKLCKEGILKKEYCSPACNSK